MTLALHFLCASAAFWSSMLVYPISVLDAHLFHLLEAELDFALSLAGAHARGGGMLGSEPKTNQDDDEERLREEGASCQPLRRHEAERGLK